MLINRVLNFNNGMETECFRSHLYILTELVYPLLFEERKRKRGK